MNLIKYRLLTEAEVHSDYPHLLATMKTIVPAECLLQAVSLAVGVCSSCRDSDRECRCWDDS